MALSLAPPLVRFLLEGQIIFLKFCLMVVGMALIIPVFTLSDPFSYIVLENGKLSKTHPLYSYARVGMSMRAKIDYASKEI